MKNVFGESSGSFGIERRVRDHFIRVFQAPKLPCYHYIARVPCMGLRSEGEEH